MSGNYVRIVKVGGSLFDLPQLGERLQTWVAAQPSATNIFIAGGGTLAHAIRELDRLHSIGEVPAHWLCVRAMGVTARLLVDLLPDAALVDSVEDVRRLVSTRPSRIAVFDAMPLLSSVEPKLPGEPLPNAWSVTSDSIAARVAQIVGAAELVLLKSDLPSVGTAAEASRAGYVDEHFPAAACGMSLLRCVNFRDDAFADRTLQTGLE